MTEESPNPSAWGPLFGAWAVALAATLAALFIGELMGQKPCNLCWHQRVFMFPLAIVLAVACLRGDAGVWRYALPLALLGAALAGFHTLLVLGVLPAAIEPCSEGVPCTGADMLVLGLPLPGLSLAAFVAIALLLEITRRRSRA